MELQTAIEYAYKAHEGQLRRGTDIPYIMHPLEAMSITASLTDDVELLSASVLHDVIEDTPATTEDIKNLFGSRVAELVNIMTDPYAKDSKIENDKCSTWRIRKEACINQIKEASFDAKVVAIGDKLSNIRAIHKDYSEIGDEIWNRFHETRKSEHSWHYLTLVDALAELSGTEPYGEFCRLVHEVFD